MRHVLQILVGVALCVRSLAAEPPPAPGANVRPLFDDRTLAGWEGSAKIWRVQDGALTGGSLTETVRQNEFLATTRDYTNFVVRFKIKLTGSNGFINSGFQIRSQRVPNNSEMAGYQCDFGEPNWYGAIYDESRRNRLIAASDMKALRPVIKMDDWNDYIIRADGVRVTTWINGVMGVDYEELETGIPNFDWGKLGIQVHGGGKALVQVKDISIEELPPTPGRIFRGAPEPKKSAQHSEANRAAAQTAGTAEPVSPEEERARFTVPPGFVIELVAAEDIEAGIGKFVTVDWDQHGNLWTMTALEYPVDANENAAAAKELYASKARDKVLVYDLLRDGARASGAAVSAATRPAGVSPALPTAETAVRPAAAGTAAPLPRYASKPRVFADGLAIPLGILPYKNGVYVQHGPDIVFLSDNDGDGRADKREVILTGFGVQDSHLFPHQFTRAPGDWIWFAQGAFNYGKVKTTRGAEIQFDQTRMAKFRPDGSDFEITSQGPCNIWGLHITMEGETWIQEANDFGYPAMPFHEYANYPGCSQAQWKSYAPEFPPTAPHFAMGGTGLSGLAITDSFRSSRGNEALTEKDQSLLTSAATSWPEAYCDVIYIANPITRKIQAIKARRESGSGAAVPAVGRPAGVSPAAVAAGTAAGRAADGTSAPLRYALTKLPDFVQSSDEMFRPVALRLGPDGCLYIVDWYNKIISHNEVPRNHPERDKKRGRIWRVRPADFNPLDVPDFTKLSGDELLAKLGGENTTQSHLAWQAIGDRKLRELAPKLKSIINDRSQTVARRIAALWALEEIRDVSIESISHLLRDTDRNVRREVVRALGEAFMHDPPFGPGATIEALKPLANDPDPQVRAEVIKVCGWALGWNLEPRFNPRTAAEETNAIVALMAEMAKAPLDAPTTKSTQSGRTIKTGDAYEREFERYLVRFFLEKHPHAVAAFLKTEDAEFLPLENRLLAALALEPRASASYVARLLPSLTRAPGQEELLRLAQFPDEPGVADALKKILQQPATSTAAIESLLKVRTKLDAAKVTPLLTASAQELLRSADATKLELGTRLASSFQLASVEPELVRVAKAATGGPLLISAVRALREIKSGEVEWLASLAKDSRDVTAQSEAIAALAASRDTRGPQQLASLYPSLPALSRRAALASLTSTKPGASALVKSVRSGAIAKDEVDAATLDRLQAVLGNDANLAALMQEMESFFRPVLRLDGKNSSYVDSNLELRGPFTVETWVKLEGDISNRDGILGAPDVLDINFAAGLFRVWVSGGQHDVVIAKKKTVPGVWTHYAVTRDAKGVFRIYINGELDATGTKANTNAFAGVDIGRTIPSDAGTDGFLAEYRVWNRARTAEEIRSDFDRSFEGDTPPPGLMNYFADGGSWGKLSGGARVVKTMDFPPLLTPAEAKALAEKFQRFHSLAAKSGEAARGKVIFNNVCVSCHSVAGQGGQIGPVLNGAGALGVEALLRNILTPNAAMEPGYRAFRVELKDGDVLDGIRVSEDRDAIVLRRQNVEDTRIPQSEVRRAAFTKTSMMPEGLLDALKPEEVTDLFAYLKTLK